MSATGAGATSDDLLVRVREVVGRTIPKNGRVLVVAKTDAALLSAAGDGAAPFPQGADGGHAGFYPGDSTQAIEMLTAARRRGGTHLLFPDSSFWWLDHYETLRAHLGVQHRCVWRDDRCALYELSPLSEDTNAAESAAAPDAAEELAFWRTTAEQRGHRVKQLEQTCESLWRRAGGQAGSGDNIGTGARSIFELPFDLNRIVEFPEAEPIFVVGASRSGTTAMGNAVRKALNCFGWMEGHLFPQLPLVMSAMKERWDALLEFEIANPDLALNHFDFYGALNHTAETFNDLYAKHTAEAGLSRWLDKTPEPGAIIAIPLLNRMYPRATYLFMHRNPIKRTLSFLKRFKVSREATMEMGILSWKACMDAWTKVREDLRPGSFAEFRQDDLTARTDEVIARLSALLHMTPHQQAIARDYFLSERPEFTGSGDADGRELTLEDVDWPEEFKRWCVTTCGETATAWGYRLTRNGEA